MQSATEPARAPQTNVIDLDLKLLRPSPYNPRKNFDAGKLKELADSIKAKGVLTPLLVRPKHDADTTPEIFEILAGERRSRAAKLAGLAVVPCVIREVDDTTAIEMITIENLQREDLHPLEEAEGYKQLLAVAGYDIATLAKRVGKSQSYIYQRVKLTELVGDAKKAFVEEVVSAGHAVQIARLQPADQGRALEELRDRAKYDRPLSVKRLGEWIAEHVHLDLNKAPWKMDDAKSWPKAGSCADCPKREKTSCLDPECYAMKTREHFVTLEAKLGAAGASVVQISTEYRPDVGGALGENDWKPAKPNSCDRAQIGLLMDNGFTHTINGYAEVKRGQQLTVCIDRKCQVHWKKAEERDSGAAAADNAAFRAKQRKLVAVNGARVTAVGLITSKAAWPLNESQLTAVALAFWKRTANDSQRLACKAWGIEAKGDYEKLGAKFIQEQDRRGLAGTLTALALLPAWGKWGHEHYTNQAAIDQLRTVGKRLGVNVEKMEREALAALREKSKPKLQTSAKGKKAKRKKAA